MRCATISDAQVKSGGNGIIDQGAGPLVPKSTEQLACIGSCPGGRLLLVRHATLGYELGNAWRAKWRPSRKRHFRPGGRQSAGWRLRQWPTTARLHPSTNRRICRDGRPSLRHLSAAPRLSWMRQVRWTPQSAIFLVRFHYTRNFYKS